MCTNSLPLERMTRRGQRPHSSWPAVDGVHSAMLRLKSRWGNDLEHPDNDRHGGRDDHGGWYARRFFVGAEMGQ
jgi:hypothetical protein